VNDRGSATDPGEASAKAPGSFRRPERFAEARDREEFSAGNYLMVDVPRLW
jgi:hypothetical protein